MELYQIEETNRLRRIINWIVDLVVVLSLAWLVVYEFGAQIQIVGQSMTPELRGGDVVLMDRLTYVFEEPLRFDVVVFEREDHKDNVKRIIGLPGETVQIQSGYIYIDGQYLEADRELNQVSLAGMAQSPITLAEDEYFLLGDNRDGSEDSRFANIGNVKREQIRGKVWLRLVPVIEIKLIE